MREPRQALLSVRRFLLLAVLGISPIGGSDARAQAIDENHWDSFSAPGWIYGGDNCPLASCRAIDSSTDTPDPSNALKIIFPAGYANGYTPALAGYVLPTPQPELYFGFWFKFSPGWTWQAVANKLTYLKLGPGTSNSFVMVDGAGTLSYTNQPGWTNTDRWYPGLNQHSYTPTPQDGFANPVIDSGRWYWLEAHARVNTPGLGDGLFELWLDGVPVLRATDVPFRGSDGVLFSYYSLEPIWGGAGSQTKPKEEYVWYDRAVASLSPIAGCQALGDCTPPAAPSNLTVQ